MYASLAGWNLKFSQCPCARPSPVKPLQENFEVAASPVPHLLLPAFRAARAELLRALRASIAAGDFEGTAGGELLDGCGLRAALHPNVLLAVLWASQVR
jgi:hypothetical protein